jgi:hypothetical protein
MPISGKLPQPRGTNLADEMVSQHPAAAWFLSLCLHSAVFLALAWSLQFVPRGVALDPDRTVGVVLVHQQEGRREYVDGPSESEQVPAPAAGLESVLPSPQDIPVDLSDMLPGPRDMPLSGLADLTDATSLPSRGARRGGDQSGTSTEVFGVPGHGSKFVYVFDRSGSMDGYGGRPLRAAKTELLSSLQDLDRVHQFQIIFYNEEPRVFQSGTGHPQMVFGDERGKERAAEFVKTITATGGTRHEKALELALRMNPDVIFFLTDADEPQLTAEELDRIRRWNRGTAIHAIEFGFGPRRNRDNFLTRLAARNGGRHAYVDMSSLGPTP